MRTGDVGVLTAAAQRGDRAAFGALYAAYYARAYHWLLAEGHQPVDAADWTQEAFLKAFQAIGRTRPDLRFYPWLLAILKNLVRDAWRHRHGRSVRMCRLLLPEAEDLLVAPPLPRGSAAQALWQRVLPLLRPAYRQVLMCQCAGWSIAETAQRLGTTTNTVKNRRYHARQQLRALIVTHIPPEERPVWMS